VAECRLCDNFDFTNRTSICDLSSNVSTVAWKTYENIDIEENGQSMSLRTSYMRLELFYSLEFNLYIIDI
jgi:hypothetical protein